MTNRQLHTQIVECAQAELDAGATIEINGQLPYVALTMSDGSEYFFQGEEASNLLDEYEAISDKFDVSVREAILHSAQGW